MTNAGKYTGLIKLALTCAGIPLLAYALGIRQTVSLYSEYRGNLRMIERHEALPADSITQRKTAAVDLIRNGRILNMIEEMIGDKPVSIGSFSPHLLRKSGGLELHAGEIVLRGGFSPLTGSLYEIERSGNCTVASVRYFTQDDPGSRRRELMLKIVFQQVSVTEKR